MKRIIVLIALPILISSLMISDAKAGNGRFSVGAELAPPLGDFADRSKTGYGGSLRYELPVGYSIDFTLTAGYITFAGKDFYDGTTLTEIPIQLGIKGYFKEDQDGLYLQLLMGLHVSSSDAVGSQTRSNFSWAPEMGYQFANVDIDLRYQLVTTKDIFNTKYLGLRAAYVFGSK